MILITGATGRTGSEVVKELQAKGAQIRAMDRNPDRVATIQGQGIGAVLGDFEKPETIETALQGVEKAFLVSIEGDRMAEQHRNFVAAAKRAGVRHLVRLSILVSDPNSPLTLGKWHGEADQHVIDSGIPYTILRPAAFMQNFLMQAAMVSSNGAVAAPLGDGKIGYIDMRDIASVATTVLTSSGHEGKTYPITGPESLSMDEVAGKLSAALGKEIKYINISPAEAKAAMTDAGMPDYVADAWLQVYQMISTGAANMTVNTVKDVTGSEARDFGQFARDYKSVFKSG